MIVHFMLAVAAAEPASIVSGPSGHVTLAAQEVEFVLGDGDAREAVKVSEIIAEARDRRSAIDDVESSIEDVSSAIVYLAKHSECESASASSTGSDGSSTGSASAIGAIEQAVFAPSDEITPMPADETLFASGRGLVPRLKGHPLAYTCRFEWGSGASASTQADVIAVPGSRYEGSDAQEVTCAVPQIRSNQVATIPYTMKLDGVFDGAGRALSLSTDVPAKQFAMNGPSVSVEDEVVQHRVNIGDADEDETLTTLEIMITVADADDELDDISLAIEWASGATTVIRTDLASLTKSGPTRTLSLPLEAFVDYGAASFRVTATDSFDQASDPLDVSIEIVESKVGNCEDRDDDGNYVYPEGLNTFGNGRFKAYCRDSGSSGGGPWMKVAKWDRRHLATNDARNVDDCASKGTSWGGADCKLSDDSINAAYEPDRDRMFWLVSQDYDDIFMKCNAGFPFIDDQHNWGCGDGIKYTKGSGFPNFSNVDGWLSDATMDWIGHGDSQGCGRMFMGHCGSDCYDSDCSVEKGEYMRCVCGGNSCGAPRRAGGNSHPSLDGNWHLWVRYL